MGENKEHGTLHAGPQLCVNCKWFERWDGVCTNGDSENRGGFVWGRDDTCDQWEAET